MDFGHKEPAPLANWVSMPTVLVTGSTVMQNLPFSSLVVTVTIASTHFAYSWRDDPAELAWYTKYKQIFNIK